MTNEAVAALFLEMSELLDIRGGDMYRARSFRRAARIIEKLREPLALALQYGRLQKRRGIGDGTIVRIKQMLRTGSCPDLDKLRGEMPTGVRELLAVDGLGPKSVRLIYTHLRIGSIAELEHAARSGALARLPRWGERGERRILRAIEDHRRKTGRTPLCFARRIGEALAAPLRALEAVQRVELTGSSRRGRPTVGDLDILVASYEPQAVLSKVEVLPQVEDVLLRGEQTRVSLRLAQQLPGLAVPRGGQRVDVRVVVPETFGAALCYFTGGARHNIMLRVRGNKRGLKISEYGVFLRAVLDPEHPQPWVDPARVAGAEEREVFAAVDLPWIPPELRENRGELEAAARGELPDLLRREQLRGDLRVHVGAGAGAADVARVAAAARAAGLGYVAVTRRLQRGEGRALREHLACVREVARSPASEGVALLAAVEVDIEPDGALALEAALLREADWVVASLHAALDQTRDELTRRLVRAIDSGVVDCIGHPLGHVHFDARELGEGEGDDALDAGEVEAPRPALPIDFDAVVYAAARADVALELDGHPARLDLDAEACRRARGRGALLALSSDARSLGRVGDLELALTTARRGWVEARHVLNARDVQALRAARERRLSGQGRAFDGLRRGERVERSGIARVAAELEAQPSEALLERLRAWLQGEDDGEIGEALALLSPEPMQLAVEILIAGDRAIGPRTSA